MLKKNGGSLRRLVIDFGGGRGDELSTIYGLNATYSAAELPLQSLKERSP